MDTAEFLFAEYKIPPSTTINGQIPAIKNPVRIKEVKIPAILLLYIPQITLIIDRIARAIKIFKIPNILDKKPVIILPIMVADQKKERTWPAENSVKALSVRKKVGIQPLSPISAHV